MTTKSQDTEAKRESSFFVGLTRTKETNWIRGEKSPLDKHSHANNAFYLSHIFQNDAEA